MNALPPKVLDDILSRLPLVDRIGSCSAVNEQFHQSAAAATTSISKDLQADGATHDSLQLWLQQHGKELSSLQLSSPSQPLTALPCEDLRQLDLTQCRVSLQQPGVLDSCSALNRLSMESCIIVGAAQQLGSGSEAFAPLASLTGLQHLHLDLAVWLDHSRSPVPFVEREQVLSSSILQKLSQLTYISIGDGIILTDESFLSLAAATGLQQWRWKPWECTPELRITSVGLGGIQHLSALTRLDLHLDELYTEWGWETLPALIQFTALQHLCLHWAKVKVSALPQCPGLTNLELQEVEFEDPGANLLSYLGSLTQLSILDVSDVYPESESWPDSPAAYTAFAASGGSLQHFSFSENEVPADEGLPEAVLEQLLSVGLQAATNLRSLHLCPAASDRSATGIHLLRSVLKLSLEHLVVDVTAVGAMSQLTCLCLQSVAIDVGGDAGSHDSAATGDLLHMLSELQQLQHLRMANLSSSLVPWVHRDKSTAWPPASPAYTALLASSSLQYLSCHQLPAGALRHALGMPHQLPQLTSLYVGESKGEADTDALDTAAISAMVSTMPALQTFNFHIAAAAQLDAFAQLQGLTDLSAELHSSSALQVLSVNTGLKQLHLTCLERLDGADLAALTALRQLRTLSVCSYPPESAATGPSAEARGGKINLHFKTKTGLDDAPGAGPVWKQLQQHCALLGVSDSVAAMNLDSD